MSCELDLVGMDEIIKKLEDIGRKGNQAINKALEIGSQPILDNMKDTNMFDDRSGRLRESLKISKIRTKKGVKYIWIGDVDRLAPCGWYVENGDSKHVARPFMRTAWREEKEQALKIIKEELSKAIQEEGE